MAILAFGSKPKQVNKAKPENKADNVFKSNTESLCFDSHASHVWAHGFGKPQQENNQDCCFSFYLQSYLAGLIEGDGHIAVHDKKSKSKVFRPKILIVFNIHDKPLALKLSVLLKVGKVIDKSAGHVLLQILAKKEVLKIINIINGRMRTPKIEALHRAIAWINENDNCFIFFLGLDCSALDSNSWLAGFSDADANFNITISERKKNKAIRTNVQTSFRIEVKQNYSRDVSVYQGGASFFSIMTKITEFFTVNLYTRTRSRDNKYFYSFIAIAHNRKSQDLVREYFDRFPLYSSKYLAYKDWCRVQDIRSPLSLSVLADAEQYFVRKHCSASAWYGLER